MTDFIDWNAFWLAFLVCLFGGIGLFCYAEYLVETGKLKRRKLPESSEE